ncbi:hypothetical protein F5Y14DRAFT_452986 [Nemania sp. NC0429]|nr:hypothetical protein F5Y14DRAFT_452986 [Nemania sp. NC0429]
MAASSSPCIFFQQGRCRYGDACRFRHAAASSIPDPRPDPRSQVPCKFYLEGICKQGTNCPYRHDPSDSSFSEPVPPQPDNDTSVRVIRGALVRYGDGACVTSLSLPSEYSSVRLDGLPANTTPADVIEILENLGHEVEVDGLRIVAMPQSSLCSAYISTPDVEFAKTLSASLIGAPYRNLKAAPVPPRLPSWASTRRARCNKLNLRWTAPRRDAWIFCDSHTAALRLGRMFNRGRYKVLNTRIHCDEPLTLTDSFAIKLLGLPDRCSAEMVEDSITGVDRGAKIEVMMKEQVEWEKETVDSIKSLLSDAGPIEFMSKPYEHDGGYWTASAHFSQDCDAQEAVRLIEKESDSMRHDVKLTARLLYSSRFKVSKEVYHHVQQRLQDSLEELDAPRMNVTCRDTGTILSLESWSSKQVAKCANVIEDIVAGNVIEGKDGKPFWVPQLASKGSATKRLKEIQQRHGVLLLPNRSKRELRCFGDSSKQTAVQEDVVRSLTENVEGRHTVDIDDAGFSRLCLIGFDLLKTLFGDNVVSLNVTSNPKKLIVNGSDEEYCEVLALLEANNITFAVKEPRSEDNCSICFTPADNPVVLGCGHTYCADCFEGLCRNSITQADTNVICTGAEDKCKKAIPLREIQAHTDPSTFEQLLESSFSKYIARRPDQFHYCPTPDCGYIYRPASASASSLWHMCPKCLQGICRSCHANHDGQRCDQHRAFQAFEAYKHENRSNVKDCPKCHTTVEKIDGCNHMRCGGCNIHLCWECLETFDESGACYAHMTRVHGGIGIDDEHWHLEDEEEDEEDNEEDNEDDEEDEEEEEGEEEEGEEEEEEEGEEEEEEEEEEEYDGDYLGADFRAEDLGEFLLGLRNLHTTLFHVG